jgi:flavorubredoxin
VFEEGMIGQSDAVQLEYAAMQGRVIYTFNVGHFCQLHAEYLATDKTHAGIVVVYRQRYTVGEQMRKLLRLAETQSAEDMRNCLHFL